MSQGTIKKLTDKGFGFITGDDGEIFFHNSALDSVGVDELREKIESLLDVVPEDRLLPEDKSALPAEAPARRRARAPRGDTPSSRLSCSRLACTIASR